MSYPPALEVKRLMLTQARDEYRAKGFAAEINVESLKVQQAGKNEDVAQQIADQELTAKNCYASARRMDEMLLKLPKPKDDKKTR